jgi:tetratricopeptide (TPR) repeat protein
MRSALICRHARQARHTEVHQVRRWRGLQYICGGHVVQTEIDRWLAEGEALLAHKDYALALVPLNRVTREARSGPTSSDAWRLKSRALVSLGHLEQALTAADHAAQDQPDDLRALKQRAKVYELLKRYPEAIADWQHAAQIEPTNARLWEHVGDDHLALGNDTAALHAFDAALVLQSDMARAVHGRAVALDHLGRRNESLAAYARARQVIPRDDPSTSGPSPIPRSRSRARIISQRRWPLQSRRSTLTRRPMIAHGPGASRGTS